jgi:hypothetical protein
LLTRAAAEISHNLTLVLFGMYVWELVVGLEFDWRLVARRKPFRWSLVRPLLCPYAILSEIKRIWPGLRSRYLSRARS